jgi:hypothetical protein
MRKQHAELSVDQAPAKSNQTAGTGQTQAGERRNRSPPSRFHPTDSLRSRRGDTVGAGIPPLPAVFAATAAAKPAATDAGKAATQANAASAAAKKVKGAKGDKGLKGDHSAAGSRGLPGPPGPPGPPGASFSNGNDIGALSQTDMVNKKMVVTTASCPA